MHQHKMDITTYFGNVKAMKKVVKKLKQSANGHTVVDIVYREQSISADGLAVAKKRSSFPVTRR